MIKPSDLSQFPVLDAGYGLAPNKVNSQSPHGHLPDFDLLWSWTLLLQYLTHYIGPPWKQTQTQFTPAFTPSSGCSNLLSNSLAHVAEVPALPADISV